MSSSELRYEEIPEWSREAVEQALRDDEPDRLLRAVLAVAMHDADWRYAQDLCVRLSAHAHFNVRGNAVLGFGHIARVHRQLDQAVVQPIIETALHDADDLIRGQSNDAADDTALFLGWKYDHLPVVYQLTLQFRGNSFCDADAIEALEDELLEDLGGAASFDRRDIGSDETNIFMRTSDPLAAFQRMKPVLARGGFLPVVGVAYREFGGRPFIVIWPEGSEKEFSVE